MRATAFEQLHRFKRRLDIARDTQIVAVEMDRVRQPDFVHDFREARDDLGWRELVVAVDRLVEDTGVLSPLPRGHATRVDRLYPVPLRGPDKPCDHVPRPFEFTGLQQIQHELVVGHQDQRGFIHDRNIAEFFVGVAGGKNRHSRFIDRGPPHPRIQVPCREGRGCDAPKSHAQIGSVDKSAGLTIVFGSQPASEVECRTGNV